MGGRLTIGIGFPGNTSILEVYNLARTNRIVKIVDSGIFTKFSNPTEFGRMLEHLWAADEVQFTAPYIPLASYELPAVVYTVPRTGTHVVKEVHCINSFLHFEHWLTLHHPLLNTLLRSRYIVGVTRKNLIDIVCSKEINKVTPEVMITTKKLHGSSLQRNTDIVKQLPPITVDLERVGDYLEEMVNYYNQLIALKTMFSKHVSFCLLDDLAIREDLNVVKNPYRYQDLIVNYQEVCDLVNTEYQPAYEYVTNQVITHCGLALSGIKFPSVNNFS